MGGIDNNFSLVPLIPPVYGMGIPPGGESNEGSSPASMAAAGKGSSSSSSNSFGGGGVGKSTAAAGGASPASGGGGEDMPAALKMYSQDELDKIRAFVAKVYKMNPFSGWLEKRNPSGWGYKTRYVTIRQFQLDYFSSPEEPVLGTLRFDASIWTHEAGQDANLFSMKSTSDQRVYQWRIPQGSDHSRQAWMDAIRKRMKACAFIEQLKQAVDCRPKRPAPAVTGRDKVQRPSASSDSPTEATTTTKMSSGGAAGGWSPSVRREDGKSSGRPFGGAASGLSRDASGSSSSLGFSSRRRGAAGLGKGSSSFGGDGGSGVFVLPHSASNDGEVAITATKRIGSAHR